MTTEKTENIYEYKKGKTAEKTKNKDTQTNKKPEIIKLKKQTNKHEFLRKKGYIL